MRHVLFVGYWCVLFVIADCCWLMLCVLLVGVVVCRAVFDVFGSRLLFRSSRVVVVARCRASSFVVGCRFPDVRVESVVVCAISCVLVVVRCAIVVVVA